MSELKEQAQKHINLVMEDSTHFDSKDFRNWKDNVDGEKELVIETTLNTGKKELGCFSVTEIEFGLDMEAEKHEVVGVINEEDGCEDCPWEDRCTL